jgi:hypothetical protein
MARMKSNMLNRKSDDDLKAKLRKGGELYQHVMGWRFVQMHKAQCIGDIEN